jgi:hypothetical protein
VKLSELARGIHVNGNKFLCIITIASSKNLMTLKVVIPAQAEMTEKIPLNIADKKVYYQWVHKVKGQYCIINNSIY